ERDPDVRVQPDHLADEELGVRAERPERHGGPPRLERARRHLGEERGEQQVAAQIDDRRPVVSQRARDAAAADAAAEHQRAPEGVSPPRSLSRAHPVAPAGTPAGCLTAETSTSIWTALSTRAPPVSRAAFQVRPKSVRSSWPRASIPT